jgi:hypothetical protein
MRARHGHALAACEVTGITWSVTTRYHGGPRAPPTHVDGCLRMSLAGDGVNEEECHMDAEMRIYGCI